MTVFFNGWIGYGTAVQGWMLVEPMDAGYLRRPFVLGDLDSGIVSDAGGGTVGPAVQAWGQIGYMGLFDQQAGGNLVAWTALPLPLVVTAGGTITSSTGGYRFLFPDLQASRRGVVTWPAGVVIAQAPDGRALTAGVAIQVAGGQLSAQASAFGATVIMGSLPTAPPSGSGLLWNNGGVISIA